MLDIKRIYNDFNEAAEKLATHGVTTEELAELKELDDKRRELLVESGSTKVEHNTASVAIVQAKRNKENASEQTIAMQKLSVDIKVTDAELAETDNKLAEFTTTLSSIPAADVPVGANEDENVEVRRWRIPRDFDFGVKTYWDLDEDLDILDWGRGARVTGSRFLFYKGLSARLECTIYNSMSDEHAEEGYTEVIPPYVVDHGSMFNTDQYPKSKEDTFELADSNCVLILAAEMPSTNYCRGEILNGKEFLVYFIAMSPSLHSEADSAGRDTCDLIRLHQFHEVEMMKFSKPGASYDELEKMVTNAENILRKFGLPYRIITLCTSDMGFPATRTYDLEVWVPTQNTYREISGCSNTKDFQARRVQVRYRDEVGGKIRLLHTFSGSGLAVGRTVAVVPENCQNKDGSVTIPKALYPYMDGVEIISPRQ